MVRSRRFFLEVFAAAALSPQLARAQKQPLRIVVPFSADSGTDLAVRVLAENITKSSGWSVIVDNRGGAGGVLGATEVARARPDGNTVLFTTGGFTTNAVLMKKLPYNSDADFTPITRLMRSSGFALLVGDKSAYKTLNEFVAAARAKPGALTFGSSGVGNTTHVMGVLFCKGVGVDLLHVPFKGTPTTELIAGTVDSAFLSPAIAHPQIRAGQLHALGISGSVRSSMLPEVPTFDEAGLKVQDIPAWSGVWAPARTPPAVVEALYDTLATAAQTPNFVKFLRDSGGEVDTLRPEPFKAYVASEIERYRKTLPPLDIEMD